MPTTYTWSGNTLRIALTMTWEQAESCSHPGRWDEGAEHLARELSDQTDAWPAEDLKAELKAYGAWDDAELVDHGQNILRMVWIAACDIADDPNCYRDDVE